MALGKAAAVVIGSFPLGESDRVVTFFSRERGKIRGVAKAARRMKSRFSGALELLTVGHLVYFDTGRSDLVQIDHFDVIHPFGRVREDLEQLGQAAWMVECVGRLTADRDPNPAVYGLLLRALKSVERGVPPRRVAVVFGLRCVDALGHRLRIDGCVLCGRRRPAERGRVAMDVDAGGVVCDACAAGTDLPHVDAEASRLCAGCAASAGRRPPAVTREGPSMSCWSSSNARSADSSASPPAPHDSCEKWSDSRLRCP